MKVLVFVCFILSSSFATRLITSDEIETLFKKALNQNLNEEETTTLQDVFDIVHRPEYASTRSLDFLSDTRATLDCLICRSAVSAFFDLVQSGQEDSQLVNAVDFLCVTLGIQSAAVCSGVLKLNIPILSYIVKNVPDASPTVFCGHVIQSATVINNSACPFEDPRFDWQVELPPGPTEPVIINEKATEPLTVAILTDAHIDPLYEPFGVADCGEPTCCRKGQSPAQNYIYKSNVDESIIAESIIKDDDKVMLDLDLAPKIRTMKSASRTRYPRNKNVEPAGYWGDYRDCDTPIWAYDDVIDRISETHKNIDVIYYIGDTIDHGVWETTYELINEMNLRAIEKIRTNFGENLLVVPAIGNHESQPTNQFAPATVTGEGLNTTWLYEALADKWGSYLTEDAKKTLRTQGDFSVLVRPGLRAISLNNNVAYKMNWWIMYDPLDAKRHLDWLVMELYKAEQAGEKVHILTHIPPGVHDLTHTWTREYNRIVNRFSSTIAAEFNGHTHSDEFKIFYNDEGAPINVAWGGGSATTYSYYNHNYKIATFNPSTFEPMDIVNYVYNMTEANLTPHRRPHWFQLYNMRNSFQLPDLTPVSMNELIYGMVTKNRHFLDLYSAFFSKLNDNRWASCNDPCKLDALCKIVVTVLWERQKCEELTNLFYA